MCVCVCMLVYRLVYMSAVPAKTRRGCLIL